MTYSIELTGKEVDTLMNLIKGDWEWNTEWYNSDPQGIEEGDTLEVILTKLFKS